jgi:DNA-binding MarR family transcriptional regulator
MTKHGACNPAASEALDSPATPPDSINPSTLDGSMGFALRKAYQYAAVEVAKVLELFDLRPQDYAVMDIIGANPGRTQVAISAAYGIQTTNFVALITKLEHRHLVERRKVVNNRRAFALHLTSQGEEMLREVEAAHALHEERMRSRLGEARSRLLIELLHAFVNAT